MRGRALRKVPLSVDSAGSRETASDSDGHLDDTCEGATSHEGSCLQVVGKVYATSEFRREWCTRTTALSRQILRLQQVRCSTSQRRILTRSTSAGPKNVDVFMDVVVENTFETILAKAPQNVHFFIDFSQARLQHHVAWMIQTNNLQTSQWLWGVRCVVFLFSCSWRWSHRDR